MNASYPMAPSRHHAYDARELLGSGSMIRDPSRPYRRKPALPPPVPGSMPEAVVGVV